MWLREDGEGCFCVPESMRPMAKELTFLCNSTPQTSCNREVVSQTNTTSPVSQTLSFGLSKPRSSRSWDPWTGDVLGSAFCPLRDAQVLACMLVCTCTCRCPARHVRDSPCGRRRPRVPHAGKQQKCKHLSIDGARKQLPSARHLCRAARLYTGETARVSDIPAGSGFS